MGIVSLLSTIIYVATFFTMFLAVFSYIAFKLREGRRKKSKIVTPASPSQKRRRLLRVYLVEQIELVGTLKWYDKLGIRMVLTDGREVTVCRHSILYFEELDTVEMLNEADANEVVTTYTHTGTADQGRR
ncbi:MAG: hypothetical protein HYR55_02365 [Acidobacteria bacterium]|nr:hypothetical protein [Acidobacteriota bacterium]MBI3655738.1 hypothetical protein [Acidobacteriota bacterium]